MITVRGPPRAPGDRRPREEQGDGRQADATALTRRPAAAGRRASARAARPRSRASGTATMTAAGEDDVQRTGARGAGSGPNGAKPASTADGRPAPEASMARS